MIVFGGMYVYVDTRELAVEALRSLVVGSEYDTLIKGGLKGAI